MVTIDLSDANSAFYKGCRFAKPEDKFPINERGNHLAIYRNALAYVEAIPESECDNVLLIGSVPLWIYQIAFNVSEIFFKKSLYSPSAKEDKAVLPGLTISDPPPAQ
ncbi:MAG TPA: hypothetical protein VGE35_02015 [Candidatus Paceibacterota bacterium]